MQIHPYMYYSNSTTSSSVFMSGTSTGATTSRLEVAVPDSRNGSLCQTSGNLCLAFGSEDLGIPEDVMECCDAWAYIPQKAQTSSLNLNQCVTIALYERMRLLEDEY